MSRRLPPNPEDDGFVNSRKDTIEFWKVVYANFDFRTFWELKEVIDDNDNYSRKVEDDEEESSREHWQDDNGF